MTSPTMLALLDEARRQGARFRLGADGSVEAAGEYNLEGWLLTEIRTRLGTVSRILRDEMFDESWLTWRRTIRGYIARVDDGATLTVMSQGSGSGYALAWRECDDCPLIGLLGQGDLRMVIDLAEAKAAEWADTTAPKVAS